MGMCYSRTDYEGLPPYTAIDEGMPKREETSAPYEAQLVAFVIGESRLWVEVYPDNDTTVVDALRQAYSIPGWRNNFSIRRSDNNYVVLHTSYVCEYVGKTLMVEQFNH